MRALESPPCPHIICEGGFAWHDNDRLQGCFVGDVSADAEMVDKAINAIGDRARPTANPTPAIDRLIAISKLRAATTNLVMRRLFRQKCPNCGANHWEVARQSLVAIERYVHPGAIDAIRAANVSIVRLRFPDIRDERALATPPRIRGIPVIPGDAEGTRIAQIAYAAKFL